MKQICVKKLKSNGILNLKEVGRQLGLFADRNAVDVINWENYPYLPKVGFCMANAGTELWLKFDVREKHVLALETQTNGPVHKDSTVEFFISFDGNDYYNFEFNCIGTRHLAYGGGRGNRTPVAPEIAEQIRISSSLGKAPFDEKTGDFSWEMVIAIPISCFVFSQLETLQGLRATANFYKCGDNTSVPHFVSWNPIETLSPDFHRPEYFGKLQFD